MSTQPCAIGRFGLPSLVFFSLAIFFPAVGRAAPLKEARVTRVIKDVKLLPNAAAPRPAAVNDDVRDDTAVRTGTESRSELTFPDQTLARLGANTIFTFEKGTRSMELTDGAMLLRVPKGAGGATIRTAAVTAAITGTTVLMEHHKGGQSKFVVLEGTARISLNSSRESKVVEAGEMVAVGPNDSTLPDPFKIDLARLMETSALINDFPPLASVDLISREVTQQEAEQSAEAPEESSAGQSNFTNVIDKVALRTDAENPLESPTPCQPDSHAHTDNNSDADDYANANDHADANRHADTNRHAHAYADRDANADADRDADAHDHTLPDADA